MTTDSEVIRMLELFLKSPFYRKIPIATSWRVPPSAVRNPAYQMICSPPNSEGFAEWEPVDSPIDEEIVSGFERYLGVNLPSAFKSFLMYKCILGADLDLAKLPEIDPRHPFGWLEWSVMESRRPKIRNRPWYIPFTLAREGMGVLCFDSRRPNSDGDYPVILADDLSVDSTTHQPVYVEFHESFGSYCTFICDYLEYIIGNHYETQRLSGWLSEQGRQIPNELIYYQS